MNRFLVFGGDCCYPSGGWDDFIASFVHQDEAIRQAKQMPVDWWHVIDLETGNKIVGGDSSDV